MLFKDEVYNVDALAKKLIDITDIQKIRVCVVCFLFDKNNNLILLRRGPGARDEVGKIQAIGGSVNKSDVDFRSALTRELNEEIGSLVNVSIDNFIGAVLNKTKNKLGDEEDWIILGYKGSIISGEIKNGEVDRCVGFEVRKIDEYNEDELSSTTYQLLMELMK